MNLFDYAEARAARDEALERVSENSGDFMTDAARAFQRKIPSLLSAGVTTVTGEDVREVISAEGVEPHHHNAWGALTLSLRRQGLLISTNEFRPMRGPKSHARVTRVYRLRGAA